MPITGHPVHPTGTQIVANLERLAAAAGANGLPTPSHTQNTSHLTQRPSTNTTEVPSTVTAKPPRKRNKTKGKNKRNKRKRGDKGSGSETEDVPIFDPADLKNSDKTALQLRYLAEEHSSSGMSDEILESVLEFHEEMQTLIAIKALKLGTTVLAIEAVFGKYIGVRRPSRWNRFLQSPRARAVFKAACGVGSGEGMRQLSVVWKSMSEVEKEVYNEATQEADLASLQAMDKDLANLAVGSRSRDQILQSASNTVINPRSLKKYKDNANRYLDDVMKHCVPVAKSNHFEMIIVAVSNHISDHSFQMTRSTVGVKKIVEEIYAIDGVNKFATEVQAHLVGRKPSELTKSQSENARKFHARVVASLSTYCKEVTGLKHWPWSNCDATFKEAGFKFELLPGA
ncbi:uncharacterized protein MELLADRAFT_91125 [Melampsora larici-populina 98AG31]|uniref:Uncharacterized protein n=1 Tax=Melampsora larici-populina (strain 98AG31 / pathotype 3-4-7) TaxID=747676 RepID=F4R781_MELLP|nr:uncharacterized protein MELLADRAFT_91125 [Melampsora larici-populina 98AG31]EGG11545.1 hypothetical protein MELLADRAFT_91125 [Melampsora larici-populina 98AG31]